MKKQLRLLRNEWRKEFSKRSMPVLLLLPAILTILFTLFSQIKPFDFSMAYVDSNFEDYCREQISWYEEQLIEGKDDEESLAYTKRELEAHRIMLEAGMDWTDWRYTQNLAYDAVDASLAGDTARYERLKTILFTDDTSAYFSMLRDDYEEKFSSDPERKRIYVQAMERCISEEILPDGAVDWRYAVVRSLVENQETVLLQERLRESGGAWSESTLENAKNAAAVAEYRLEKGIEHNPADRFSFAERGGNNMLLSPEVELETSLSGGPYWDAVLSSVSLLSVVCIVAIILGSTTLSAEMNEGTVKLLLTAPVKRWRILVAKYSSCVLLSLGMAMLVGVVSLLVALPFGAEDALLPAIYARAGEVYTVSPYLLLLRLYGLETVETVVLLTMAFAIAALTRRPALSVTVSLIFAFLGEGIATVLSFAGVDLGRYLLFSNLDLSAILAGNGYYPHQSVGMAVTVILLHLAVFWMTAYDAFVRRDL